MICLLSLRERVEEREREKHWCKRETLICCLWYMAWPGMCCVWEHSYVPWLGVEPATFWCTSGRSNLPAETFGRRTSAAGRQGASLPRSVGALPAGDPCASPYLLATVILLDFSNWHSVPDTATPDKSNLYIVFNRLMWKPSKIKLERTLF